MFICICFNVMGLELVGLTSVIFAIIILIPFIFIEPIITGINHKYNISLWFMPLTTYNITTNNQTNLILAPLNDYDWGDFFSTMLWNFSGWDSLGTFAGEGVLSSLS